MLNRTGMNIVEPRSDRLRIRQLRIPILKPHRPPNRPIQPIHKLRRHRMEVLHQPLERGRLLRIAHKMIVIRENSPGM
jgi:hypothetical protein